MDLHTALLWIRVFVVGAAVCTTSVPVIYAFYPWRSRRLGQLFMLQAFSFAFAMDLAAIFSFWRPTSILFRFITNLVLLTAIGVSTAGLATYIWRLNHPRKGKHWR